MFEMFLRMCCWGKPHSQRLRKDPPALRQSIILTRFCCPRLRHGEEYKVAAEAKKNIRSLCYYQLFTAIVATVWGIVPATVNKPVRRAGALPTLVAECRRYTPPLLPSLPHTRRTCPCQQKSGATASFLLQASGVLMLTALAAALSAAYGLHAQRKVCWRLPPK